jgi:hypothetical protein
MIAPALLSRSPCRANQHESDPKPSQVIEITGTSTLIREQDLEIRVEALPREHQEFRPSDFRSHRPRLSRGRSLLHHVLNEGAIVFLLAFSIYVTVAVLFVIPNDRDFQRILADPITFHTHYILEPDPAEVPISATNIQYPNLWTTGAGFTTMVHQIPSRGTCPEFRLLRVLHHSNVVSG